MLCCGCPRVRCVCCSACVLLLVAGVRIGFCGVAVVLRVCLFVCVAFRCCLLCVCFIVVAVVCCLVVCVARLFDVCYVVGCLCCLVVGVV